MKNITRSVTIVISFMFTVAIVWIMSWVFNVTRLEGAVAYLLMWVILWDARYLQDEVEKADGRRFNPPQ